MSVTRSAAQLWKFMAEGKTFSNLLKKVNFISAGNGMCKAEMMVQEEHTNNFGTLHGGMTTSLVDIVSTIALSTHKIAALGVSVDLHIEFLKAAPLGSEVVIEAKTTKAGRTLAFLEVLLTDKSTGDIIAQGSHIKFVGKG